MALKKHPSNNKHGRVWKNDRLFCVKAVGISVLGLKKVLKDSFQFVDIYNQKW